MKRARSSDALPQSYKNALKMASIEEVTKQWSVMLEKYNTKLNVSKRANNEFDAVIKRLLEGEDILRSKQGQENQTIAARATLFVELSALLLPTLSEGAIMWNSTKKLRDLVVRCGLRNTFLNSMAGDYDSIMIHGMDSLVLGYRYLCNIPYSLQNLVWNYEANLSVCRRRKSPYRGF